MGRLSRSGAAAALVTVSTVVGMGGAPATATPRGTLSRSGSAVAVPGTIGYDGVGRFRIGQLVKVAVRPDFYPYCADNTLLSRQVRMLGIPKGRGAARIAVLYVTSPRFRTASGMRVGASLATLRRTYGTNRLVVARQGRTVKGLYGMYQDVAAIRKGRRVITFYLNDRDVVTQIKISSAAAWGDDEGCV